MKAISLKLPAALSAKLDSAAKCRNQSRSALIRAALEHFLDQREVVSKGSALEAAQRWIGSLEGPSDLATNPKYMDGFGK